MSHFPRLCRPLDLDLLAVYSPRTRSGGQGACHPKRQTKLPEVNFVAFRVPVKPPDLAGPGLSFSAIEAPMGRPHKRERNSPCRSLSQNYRSWMPLSAPILSPSPRGSKKPSIKPKRQLKPWRDAGPTWQWALCPQSKTSCQKPRRSTTQRSLCTKTAWCSHEQHADLHCRVLHRRPMGIARNQSRHTGKSAKNARAVDPGTLDFYPYDDWQPVNYITIRDKDYTDLAFWQDDDLRIQLGARDLLSAAEKVIASWKTGDLAAAVRELENTIANAKGGAA